MKHITCICTADVYNYTVAFAVTSYKQVALVYIAIKE